MPNPYPRELRVRAVRAYESRTEPYPVIAARFEIGPATLMRWVQRQRETGTVDPLAKGGGWVSPVVWAVLKPLIGAKPDQTCEEFTRAYNRVAIPRIRRSTVLRTGPCCRVRDGGPRRAGPGQRVGDGGEIGRIRPTNVFERAGESRMTPPGLVNFVPGEAEDLILALAGVVGEIEDVLRAVDVMGHPPLARGPRNPEDGEHEVLAPDARTGASQQPRRRDSLIARARHPRHRPDVDRLRSPRRSRHDGRDDRRA